MKLSRRRNLRNSTDTFANWAVPAFFAEGHEAADFSRLGLDREWHPAAYEVVGSDGRLSVVEELDGAGVNLIAGLRATPPR